MQVAVLGMEDIQSGEAVMKFHGADRLPDAQVGKVKDEARKALQAHRDSLAASLDLVRKGQAGAQQMVS
jgi:hypothetical protein